MNKPRKAGLRELNQHAGKLVREVVRTGETIEITDRGVTVAVLAPPPISEQSVWERLIAAGKVTPASADISQIPSTSWRLTESPAEVLDDLRGAH